MRNWCLTRTLELDGQIDFDRHRGFRAGRSQVLANEPSTFVHGLKTTLLPELTADIDCHIAFAIGETLCGLHVRRGVAVPTDGAGADHNVTISHEHWADVISNKLTFADALSSGHALIEGDTSAVIAALACFEHPALAQHG